MLPMRKCCQFQCCQFPSQPPIFFFVVVTLAEKSGASYLRQDVGDIGLVKRRERKAFLAEVVEGRAYMDECRLVDDEEAVVEVV